MTSRLPEERFFISARRVTFTEGNKIRDICEIVEYDLYSGSDFRPVT